MADHVNGINVVSTFDGMGGLYIVLKELGVKVNKYFAMETDKFAISQSNHNFPNIINLGNITKVNKNHFNDEHIHLFVGGSPCQGFSIAGKRLNFDDPRSKLFFEYDRLRRELNPDYFLLENVKMDKDVSTVIDEYLGVEHLFINSELVSAQNRKRFYWTDIPNISLPIDRNLYLRDIIDYNIDTVLSDGEMNYMTSDSGLGFNNGKTRLESRCRYEHQKSNTISASQHKGVPYGVIGIKRENDIQYRKLTVPECAKLQTVPEWYRWIVSNTQALKMLGNGFTIDIIKHILSNKF